ncbi:MAG: VWA domain-containing protein, partial [Bacteroidales bacterium]|nr:VWA domain-containing protein [Bacteroidales bacterium]
MLTFIDKLKPEGGTLLGTALKKACYAFTEQKNKKARRSIILLGDGRSDDNVPAILKELKEKNALIQCECIGFDIVNDKAAEEQLKQIALETGGEYYVATDVTNIIKAFWKTSIKSIIEDIPVEVRQKKGTVNLKLPAGDIRKILTGQNWMMDSIQINVPANLFEIALQIVEEDI